MFLLECSRKGSEIITNVHRPNLYFGHGIGFGSVLIYREVMIVAGVGASRLGSPLSVTSVDHRTAAGVDLWPTAMGTG